MVTCFLRYEIDSAKIKEFEHYGKLWIHLIHRLEESITATYCLPKAQATSHWLRLPFTSFAEYEAYRKAAADDPECQAAVRYANETKCIRRWERTFFRPVFE